MSRPPPTATSELPPIGGPSSIDLDSINKVYGACAPLYDGTFGRLTQPYQRRLIESCQFLPGQRVIEIGVGTGLSLPLYPRSVRIMGIDAVREMLAKASERVRRHGLDNVDLMICDAESTGLPDQSFDFVMMMFVLSVTPEPATLIHEALRICKPEGHVYILNHFQGGRGVLGLETAFSSLARWIGFRSDMPLSVVSDIREPESVEALAPLGFFKLVHLRPDQRVQTSIEEPMESKASESQDKPKDNVVPFKSR